MDGEPPLGRGGAEHLPIPKLEIGAISVPSEAHPERNEDAIFQLAEQRLFGVFDGVGGHAGGARASRLARDHVARNLGSLSEGVSPQQAQDEFRRAFLDANQAVLSKAHTEGTDMGSTAVVAYIWEGEGERKAIIGSVGDSRAYIFRDGTLEQVTLDDNMVKVWTNGDEQEARRIQTRLNNVVNPNDPSQIAPDERDLYNKRNRITQAIGSEYITPNIYTVALQPGDRLLLTSDGITDNLTDHEIAEILAKHPTVQEAVEQLTIASRKRSNDPSHPRHKQDDMSAVAAEIPLVSPSHAESVIPSRQNPIETQTKLNIGDVVRVQRNSGAIEDGWRISGFSSETGEVIVRRSEGNQTLQKRIPLQKLEALNNPELRLGLSEARDFNQLFEILEKGGPIQGSATSYEPAQLKRLINQVREGRREINTITRANGLRQKVENLLLVENIRRNIR